MAPETRSALVYRSLVVGGTLLAGFAWMQWHRALVGLLPHGEDLGYLNRALPYGSSLIAIVPLLLIVYVGVRLSPPTNRISRLNQLYLFVLLVAFVLVIAYGVPLLTRIGQPQRMPA